MGAHFLCLSHGQVGWELRPLSGALGGPGPARPGSSGLWQSRPGIFLPGPTWATAQAAGPPAIFSPLILRRGAQKAPGPQQPVVALFSPALSSEWFLCLIQFSPKCQLLGTKRGTEVRCPEAWVLVPIPPLSSCVISSQSFNFSECQFHP